MRGLIYHMLNYLALDTGGFDPARRALLQVGLYHPACGRVAMFVDPAEGLTVSEGAAKVNGWPDTHQEGTVSESDAMEQLGVAIKNTKANWILCHHAAFDIPFIRAAMGRQNKTFRLPRSLCTMGLAAVLSDIGGVVLEKFSLNYLQAAFVPDYARPNPHDASHDAELTYMVMQEMLSRFHGLAALANETARLSKDGHAPTPPRQTRRLGMGRLGR